MAQPSADQLARDPDKDRLRAQLLEAAFAVARRRIDDEGSTRAGLLTLQWLNPEEVAEEASLPIDVFEGLWQMEETPEGTKLSPFEAFLSETFGVHNGPLVQADTSDALTSNTHDLEELIRIGASDEAPRGPEWLDYRLALAVSAHALHEREDQQLFYSEVEQLYQYVLYHVGCRMKPHLTVRDLVMNVAAVVEGGWSREIYGVRNPNRIVRFRATPESETKDWNIVSIGVWSIVQGMIEPIV